VAILVDDSGPGFHDYDRALRRGEGTGGVGSTGLGLDIVRKLAERTGGSLTVDRSSLGGAQVHVSFRTEDSVSARIGRPRRYARRGRG
jgi:signal transduction histidine kinase